MKKKPEKYQYKPTPFMLPTSHYDKERADHAVNFIQSLKHTKGVWAGQPFLLFDWQEQIVRDLFGIIKPNGYRQFTTAFVEICKKALAVFNGKVPTDRDGREELLDSLDCDDVLSECDDEFYEYEDNLEELNYTYIMEHHSFFE